jgi:hypothetical protein
MRDARVILTVPDCPGLIFSLAQLTFDPVNGAPRGIYVDDETYAKGQMLRERIRDGVVYRFFVSQDRSRPPQPRIPPEQRIRFKGITYIDGNDVGIRLDAGVVDNIESVSAMIDQAIETRVDPPETDRTG